VDDIEVGRSLGERVRIAINIADLAEAAAEVVGAGAAPLADPVITPWGDHNHRFVTTDGLQLTLFQPPGSAV
jgi:hypothetical protein